MFCPFAFKQACHEFNFIKFLYGVVRLFLTDSCIFFVYFNCFLFVWFISFRLNLNLYVSVPCRSILSCGKKTLQKIHFVLFFGLCVCVSVFNFSYLRNGRQNVVDPLKDESEVSGNKQQRKKKFRTQIF